MEMLVVMALITMLMALLLPAMGKSREQARRTLCAANSRGQVQACDAYSVENNSYLPPSQNESGSVWAYSFDIKSSPGGTHVPMGVGIALAKGYFNYEPKAFHCPSLDTSGATHVSNTPYHSMDVDIPNWWNSIGASWWDDPAHAGKRITIGYTYRSPSWWRTNDQNRFLRVTAIPGGTVINADILDPRFGRRYAHVQGYNFTRIDQSGDFHADPDGEIDQLAISGAVVVDGRGQPLVDEIIFQTLETGR